MPKTTVSTGVATKPRAKPATAARGKAKRTSQNALQQLFAALPKGTTLVIGGAAPARKRAAPRAAPKPRAKPKPKTAAGVAPVFGGGLARVNIDSAARGPGPRPNPFGSPFLAGARLAHAQ